MNEKKSSRGLVVALVIAIVIIFGLVFYICYDKGFIFSSNTPVEEQNDEVDEKEEEEDTVEEEEEDSTPDYLVTRECLGTYSGSLTSTTPLGETYTNDYTYVLKENNLYHVDYSNGMHEEGRYEIIGNTLVLITPAHTTGPREEAPGYFAGQHVIADDCSTIKIFSGSESFMVNKQ